MPDGLKDIVDKTVGEKGAAPLIYVGGPQGQEPDFLSDSEMGDGALSPTAFAFNVRRKALSENWKG